MCPRFFRGLCIHILGTSALTNNLFSRKFAKIFRLTAFPKTHNLFRRQKLREGLFFIYFSCKYPFNLIFKFWVSFLIIQSSIAQLLVRVNKYYVLVWKQNVFLCLFIIFVLSNLFDYFHLWYINKILKKPDCGKIQ